MKKRAVTSATALLKTVVFSTFDSLIKHPCGKRAAPGKLPLRFAGGGKRAAPGKLPLRFAGGRQTCRSGKTAPSLRWGQEVMEQNQLLFYTLVERVVYKFPFYFGILSFFQPLIR